ncbi:MAG: hypothetical protein NZ821_08840, partial [Gloeomargarita sp. SKYB31]|nr:hypothetical protein [Gloeomargarita sp. SKYB31]
LNLPNPTGNQEPATKAYVDALVEGLAWKDNVKAASTSNISISSPPSSLDGVSLTTGDRILLKDQTNAAENGIYIYNGSGNPLTRAPDANTASELINAVVLVDQGTTNAGTAWRQTNIVNTLGTDAITWQPFATGAAQATESTAGIIRIATQAETDAGTINNAAITPQKLANWADRPRRVSQVFGDTTNTVYTITHNFNTYDVHVTVYENSGNRRTVFCEIRRTSLNAVQIVLAAPPGNNALVAFISR